MTKFVNRIERHLTKDFPPNTLGNELSTTGYGSESDFAAALGDQYIPPHTPKSISAQQWSVDCCNAYNAGAEAMEDKCAARMAELQADAADTYKRGGEQMRECLTAHHAASLRMAESRAQEDKEYAFIYGSLTMTVVGLLVMGFVTWRGM